MLILGQKMQIQEQQHLKKKDRKAKADADQDFIPYERSIKIKKKSKLGKICKNQSYKPWTQEENYKYFQFLNKNTKCFQTTQLRRSNKVFRQLAKILKGRTSHQCKSHFQMLHKTSKRGEIAQILQLLREKVGKDEKISEKMVTASTQMCNQGSISDCENFMFQQIIQEEGSALKELKILVNSQAFQIW